MKFHSVDKKYFEKIISINNLKLSMPEISKETENGIKKMQVVFENYVGLKENKSEQNLTTEEILSKLSDIFKSDLATIDLKTWKRIQDLCGKITKSSYTDCIYSAPSLTIKDLIRVSLKIYKGASKELYLKAKNIIRDDRTMIYLNDVNMDNNYDCQALDCNFIACSNIGINTYPRFIHELQHSIDKQTLIKQAYIYIELAPIFFETLMCDYWNTKGDYKGLYSFRIKDNSEIMREFYEYVKILEKFDVHGQNLTISNAEDILGVDSKEQLQKIYNIIEPDDYMESIKYILSFLRSIQLRDIYYNDKKEALKQLNDASLGNDLKINYSSLARDYEKFNDEIGKLYLKTKGKRF